ncbi:MAG: hypothetical protein N2247_09535 [Leptospiraceae bacterium]|nr:hypothetical protein [Leptospiraceae bacterium]
MIYKKNNIIFLILILLLALSFNLCSKEKEINYRIEKGLLDLEQIDLYNRNILLNGEWEFYYNQLLSPKDFEVKNVDSIQYVQVPSSWEDLNLSPLGYATYRLKITHVPYPMMLGLKIPHMNSSYHLYINGELIAKNGEIDPEKKIFLPQHLPLIKFFENRSPELDIILHVANLSDNLGGIWSPIELGPEKQIIISFWKSIGIELFFFGVILIMGIYHLFLPFFRKKEKASLFFGLFCLLIALRVAVTGEKFLLQLFPDFPWEFHIKIEYLSIYLGLPTFSYYLFYAFRDPSNQSNRWNIKNFFSQEFYYPIINFIFLFTVPFILITIFTNILFFGKFLKIYQIFLIISSIYLFYGIILATYKNKEGAIFSFLGIIFVFVTLINDILYAKRIIHTGYLIPFGFFVFILFQSLTLAYKFSQSFFKNEELTNHLKELLLVFEKFIPKEFLELLNKRDITKIQLGDQTEKEMCVLFSDIRKFTSISEKLTPQENFRFINLYLSFIEPTIRENRGFIDKYLGDGFMALFPASAESAVMASIQIQTKIKEFNAFIFEKNFEPIKVGIGIHLGNLMLGVVGSESHMETTVISDAVNTAARLEKINKDFGTDILITESVLNKLSKIDDYKFRYIGTILLRGKQNPVKIYEIYNHYDEFLIEHYEKTKEDFYKAISLFTKNHIRESMDIFEEILKNNPYDNPARYYHYKCRSIIGF